MPVPLSEVRLVSGRVADCLDSLDTDEDREVLWGLIVGRSESADTLEILTAHLGFRVSASTFKFFRRKWRSLHNG